MESARDSARTIDIHAHFFPRAWLELLAAEGAAFGMTCELGDARGPRISGSGRNGNFLEARFIDIGTRIASMDEQGVDVQALSLTAPMVYWAGADLSQRLSQVFNDACATAHESHPDRLVGLAMLPMHHPQRAIEELERAATLPGIDRKSVV